MRSDKLSAGEQSGRPVEVDNIALARLIDDLEAIYAEPKPPLELHAAIDQALRERAFARAVPRSDRASSARWALSRLLDTGWDFLGSRRGRRRFAVAAVLVVALGAGILGTAYAAGDLGAVVDRYGLALVGHVAPLPTPRPEPTALPGQANDGPHYVSLAAAEQRVGFPIRQPTWLPRGLMLTGIVAPPPDRPGVTEGLQVSLLYNDHAKPRGGLTLMEENPKRGLALFVAATDHTRNVTVAGRPAAYVPGGWNNDGSWNDASDSAYLSWQAGGITYAVFVHDLGLDEAILLRLASSLR